MVKAFVLRYEGRRFDPGWGKKYFCLSRVLFCFVLICFVLIQGSWETFFFEINAFFSHRHSAWQRAGNFKKESLSTTLSCSYIVFALVALENIKNIQREKKSNSYSGIRHTGKTFPKKKYVWKRPIGQSNRDHATSSIRWRLERFI